jgi:hypothetical protein
MECTTTSQRLSGLPRIAEGSRTMTMNTHDSRCFSAGRDCGARTAACVARFTALELVDASRWWNRRRRRLMAGALVACAEDLELRADEDLRSDAGPLRLVASPSAWAATSPPPGVRLAAPGRLP